MMYKYMLLILTLVYADECVSVSSQCVCVCTVANGEKRHIEGKCESDQ